MRDCGHLVLSHITWYITGLSLRTTLFYPLVHTRITVVAACSVGAEMSRYDKPASRMPTILPRLNSFVYWYCALPRGRGIPGLAFTFPLGLETLLWLNTDPADDTWGGAMCTSSLCKVISYCWYTDLHISRVRLFFLSVAFFQKQWCRLQEGQGPSMV